MWHESSRSGVATAIHLLLTYLLTYLLDLNIPADIKRHWRRPRGRPRATWLRAIDTDVQSVNIEIHSAWRKPVTARSGDASSTRQHSAIAFIGHAATEEEKKDINRVDPVIGIRSWPSISFPALSLCPAQHLPLSDWPMTWNSPRDLSGIQRAAQTVLGVYLKRTC